MYIENVRVSFINCFVYGSIAYWLVLLAIHLIVSLHDVANTYKTTTTDFYKQLKDLMESSDEGLALGAVVKT